MSIFLKPTHQAYAEKVAGGMDAAQAWAEVNGLAADSEAARKGASRMSKNVPVKNEILRIRREAEKLAGGAVASTAELKKFLSDVVRTPVGKLGPDSPLTQKWKATRPFSEKGREFKMDDGKVLQPELWQTEEVTMPDKLKAVEMLLKLDGQFSEDHRNAAEAEAAESLSDWLKRDAD